MSRPEALWLPDGCYQLNMGPQSSLWLGRHPRTWTFIAESSDWLGRGMWPCPWAALPLWHPRVAACSRRCKRHVAYGLHAKEEPIKSFLHDALDPIEVHIVGNGVCPIMSCLHYQTNNKVLWVHVVQVKGDAGHFDLMGEGKLVPSPLHQDKQVVGTSQGLLLGSQCFPLHGGPHLLWWDCQVCTFRRSTNTVLSSRAWKHPPVFMIVLSCSSTKRACLPASGCPWPGRRPSRLCHSVLLHALVGTADPEGLQTGLQQQLQGPHWCVTVTHLQRDLQ